MNSEQYIAGAILISGEQVLGAIRGLVTAECFRLESCRAIFTAGESLLEQGQPSTRSPLPPRPGGRGWSCRIPFWQS